MNVHSNLCSADDSLLIVVDLQSKLSAVMPEADAEQMIANAGSLLEAAGILKVPVLLTEQYPQGLGPTEPTVASKLPEGTRVFEKTGFSCCAAQGFSEALQDFRRKQLILAGMEAHVCILQTALELLNLGYQVFIVADAVCSRKIENKVNSLQRLQQQGATITNHESVLFEWLKSSTHPDFKKVSGLLR